MSRTPHKEKLLAAIANPKCAPDRPLLQEAMKAYEKWITQLNSLSSTGNDRVREMTRLLNEYKDFIEVEIICKQGSSFLTRQKGQLKLDNSIIEEFLIYLVHPSVLKGLPKFELEAGPQTAFMSLSFRPASVSALDDKPDVVIKVKDQDFTIGKSIYYKFSTRTNFEEQKTRSGQIFLAVLAAECKVNLNKTMFQECAGTAARLKHGCPSSQYYVLVEYLDMEPEDSRLTDIDNVFILRKARRLPFERRGIYEEVKKQHLENPIDVEVVLRFVQILQEFVDAVWYDPRAALKRGSFV